MVRISGPDAMSIAERLIGICPEPRHVRLARIRDAGGATIDTGLALFFRAPASFTGEHVLELYAHGSPVVLEEILRAAVDAGARRAGPGEFSQRAFLNDKLDLAQAEAIADLIDAASTQAARAARRSLEGAFSGEVEALVDGVTELRVWVEAALDFPDEDVDFLADGQVRARLADLQSELAALRARAETGRILTDGIRVAIVGRPNAGKSSLLNVLSRRDAAIVTEIPGTTRDVLRETISLAGVPVVLADTAGLRSTEDVVEIEGVRRAERELAEADLVLWVVDATAGDAGKPPQTPAPVIRVNNKIDLTGGPPGLSEGHFAISALTGAGLDELEAAMLANFGIGESGDGEFSARARHVEALDRAAAHLAAGLGELDATGSGELLAEELKLAADQLGEITGRITSDELLGRIFSSFCIGK